MFIDYFAFPRGMMVDVPPFVIGRPGYDNWLLWQTRQRRIPLVDASDEAPVVHQNHDYSHIKAGADARRRLRRLRQRARTPCATRSWPAIGARYFTTNHATHVVSAGTVRPALEKRYVGARVETLKRRRHQPDAAAAAPPGHRRGAGRTRAGQAAKGIDAPVHKRFAIVAPNYYPRTCGVGDYSMRIAAELRTRGHDAVDLHARAGANRTPKQPDVPVCRRRGNLADPNRARRSRAGSRRADSPTSSSSTRRECGTPRDSDRPRCRYWFTTSRSSSCRSRSSFTKPSRPGACGPICSPARRCCARSWG